MIRRLAPLRHVVGPILFCVIAMRIDRAALFDAIAQARPAPIAYAALLVLLAIPIRAARWAGIVRRMGHGLGTGSALRLYAAGTFAGTATPGRVGEVYKAAPLTRLGVPRGKAVASVLVDRFWDVGIGAVAALLYAIAVTLGTRAVAVGAGVVVLVLVAAAGFLAGAEPELERSAQTGSLSGIRGILLHSLAAVASPMSFLRTGALTSLAALAAWIANHLLVVSLGLPLGPLETAGISAAAALATLLPVSVLGVGTRDAALLLLLAPYSIGSSEAVALSALFLGLNVWTGLACGVASAALSMVPSLAAKDAR